MRRTGLALPQARDRQDFAITLGAACAYPYWARGIFWVEFPVKTVAMNVAADAVLNQVQMMN
jgi:hypothetical protein